MPQFQFLVGNDYTRRDLRSAIGLNPDLKGGHIDTGYFSHRGAHFILCGVGTGGRTGHDYGNHFVGSELVWSGRTKSTKSQPAILKMTATDAEVHIFFRSQNRGPFRYLGQGSAIRIEDTVPVQVTWSFEQNESLPVEASPQEVSSRRYFEGSTQTVVVNRYERDPQARAECVKALGVVCSCCGFDFRRAFGELGHGFIHVHHKVPLAEIRQGYEVDPIRDLTPVCPNCHSMLHRRQPALTVEALRAILAIENG